MTRYPGVILAGGQARRMGGGDEHHVDKALLELAGRPLIERVIERLEPQCATLAISANGDPKRYAPYGFPILPDATPERQGPLAGVLAGLDWAARKGFKAIVTVAADTPFFPTNLVERLAETAAPDELGLAVTPEAERQNWHPTFGLWPVALRDDLRAALAHHQRRMMQFADSKGAVPVVFETAAGEAPFFNINTPDDLARAERNLSN